ncbi:MAG: C-GCAxxG-C-C family protein [Planctomycetota bacterium]|jgi:C_GCAxxG_C_C family probable redox protein
MKRRAFLRAGMAGLTAAGVAGFTGAALAEQTVSHDVTVDPDALASAAIKHFIPGGRTCCESVLMAGCEVLGVTSDLVPNIAFGLAGGIGLQGRTCGVVCGAALVLGIAVGRRHPEYPKNMLKVCEGVQAVTRGFEDRFGTTECRKLCGLDLTTPEGRKTLKERVKAETCSEFMDGGVRLLAQVLQQSLRVTSPAAQPVESG